MKSVPNLIFYLHESFWIFSHFLAICFELFYFGMIFNSEIIDSGPHLSDAACRNGPARQRAVAAWQPHGSASRARLKAALRTARRASRQHRPRARPDSAPPHARRCHPDRLMRAAVAPTASRVPPSPRPPLHHPDRSRSPVDAAPCRRPRAGEAPVPRPSPARRRRAAAGSPSNAAAARGPRQHREHGPGPVWPRAAPALCDWACSAQWHPVKFYDLFNSLQIQKFV
jgi:hypothetical protein